MSERKSGIRNQGNTFVIVGLVEPLTMPEEILVEARGLTLLSICPERPIGFDIEDRIAVDNFWPITGLSIAKGR
jgi:hypothetical protein